MNRRLHRSLAVVVAAGLMFSSFDGAAQAVPAQGVQAQSPASLTLSARKRHRHYRSRAGERAALRAFGIIAGTIATIAAAQAARDRYDDCCYDRYYYGGPPRRYYGRLHRWHRHYDYRHRYHGGPVFLPR